MEAPSVSWHEVPLMPAQYVKPYVKTNKNDYIDVEAVTRPTMRFVPIKTDDQLDLQSLHQSLWLDGLLRFGQGASDCLQRRGHTDDCSEGKVVYSGTGGDETELRKAIQSLSPDLAAASR